MVIRPSSDELAVQTRGVATRLKYLMPGCPKNRRFVSAGVEYNTGTYEDYDATVYDARPLRDQFDLDNQGFVLADHKSCIQNWDDFDEVNAKYESEAVAHIKQLTGADLVMAQGWMFRTTKPPQRAVANYQHKGGVQPPAGEVHCDYNHRYADIMAERFYRQAYPNGQPFKRFIATSYWRCISEPPQDWPLAVCDARSAAEDGYETNTLIVCDRIPETDDEKFGPIPGEDDFPAAAIYHFSDKHRWWFYSDMNKDEALLLKFHDSDGSVACKVPHTAFSDETANATVTRRSIEVRSIAYFF